MVLVEDTVFSLNAKYRFQWEEAQGCHVLLYPEGLIRLSESASEIIQRCLNPVSLAKLTHILCEAFPQADRDVIEADVHEFVKDALSQSWLVVRE